ncbi:MAG: hypothetical protein GWP06_09050 [Actinobacteria bacterium]|nr:hypothetical protein [Actinomycetota bacterium]
MSYVSSLGNNSDGCFEDCIMMGYNVCALPMKDFFQWWFQAQGIPDAGTKEAVTNE